MASRIFRPQFWQNLERYSRSNASMAALKQQTPSTGDVEWANAKPFNEMPGPKRWPLIGTTWQFFPYVGNSFIFGFTNELNVNIDV